jgi:DNA-binding MarR family transcriptional regulator
MNPLGSKDIPTEHLVWDTAACKFVLAHDHSKQTIAKFLKGPVPWNWIEKAAHLPGRSLAVGLCIWRLIGATRSNTIKLSNRECDVLGVTRHSKSRALKQLESAGLVEVQHRRGRFPRIKIIYLN